MYNLYKYLLCNSPFPSCLRKIIGFALTEVLNVSKHQFLNFYRNKLFQIFQETSFNIFTRNSRYWFRKIPKASLVQNVECFSGDKKVISDYGPGITLCLERIQKLGEKIQSQYHSVHHPVILSLVLLCSPNKLCIETRDKNHEHSKTQMRAL